MAGFRCRLTLIDRVIEDDTGKSGARGDMTVRIRFFARFRELFGPEMTITPEKETAVADLIRKIAQDNDEGYKAVFDEHGAFREMVILTVNGTRLDPEDALKARVTDGDEIAVFPPVAGG